MVVGNNTVINHLGLSEMGQKNCKLKPELVTELVRKTYCESLIYISIIVSLLLILVRQLHV